jgi:lysine 2,3-aminomutase
MIPSMREYSRAPGEHDDPLGEEAHSPVHGIVHTYPAKALFLVSDHCATYCRYCTRSRVVGSGEIPAAIPQWETALDYIRSHPEIEDVLISGGDPLTLTDDKLEWLLAQLHAIEHVRLIRIGTKTPAVLPQRFTPGLARMLKRYHPLWISVHFTHPRELTPEVTRAVNRLTNAGIPLANQTVLLAGINDDPATMRALMDGLVRLRIRPYYLHQCDAVTGSSHFRTPVDRGLEIIRSLHGFTTGYAVPTYMIDAPGGGGKVPIMPEYVVGRENGNLLLRNYRGEIYRYPDL